MLRKHFDKKNRNEYGLSMIELLVVIVIIGILAATAIGVTLNQRKKANDSAVESDVRNVVMTIETGLVDHPNATGVAFDDGKVTLDGADFDGNEVSLSDGVSVKVSGDPTSENGYTVKGEHVNGSKYNKDENSFEYISSKGTFDKGDAIASTPPGGDD